MGWTASYQLLLDRPLTEPERRALAALVARVNRPRWDAEGFSLAFRKGAAPDRVVAQGWNKLAASVDESTDAPRLVAALNEILALIPGSEVRVSDDFGVFGVRGGRVEPGAPRSTPPVLVQGAELEAIDAWLPTEAGGASPVEELRRLAGVSPERVVREGFERYDELREHEPWQVVWQAMRKVEDVSSIVPAFLAVWGRLEGVYWHHDMSFDAGFVAKLVAHPDVRARLEADVREADALTDAQGKERVYRRAGKAVELLAHGDAAALATLLVPVLRGSRARTLPHEHRHFLYLPALGALARTAADPRLFATLALELDRMTFSTRAHIEAAIGLIRLDRARGRALAVRAAERWSFGAAIKEVLAALGDDDEEARRWIDRFDADQAAIEAAPETMVVHPCEDLRRTALRKLHDRKDRTMFTSLAAAETVDAILRRRTDSPALPFSWWEWKGLIADQIINYRPGEKVSYAQRGGRHSLGPQVIWDSVKPILERGAQAVAAEIPPAMFRLTDEERAAYQAAE